SRPGRPPKRAPVGLSLAASHLQHHQLKKQRLDNGDYPYENGHLNASYLTIYYKWFDRYDEPILNGCEPPYLVFSHENPAS
ncbi:hypothetical protein WA026_006247, partial [Henosepilachna vigintioctopunctata]